MGRQIEKVCRECGAAFTTTKPRKLYCSSKCQRKGSYYDRKYAGYSTHKKKRKVNHSLDDKLKQTGHNYGTKTAEEYLKTLPPILGG